MLGGLETIKAHGLLEAYNAVSPPEVREAIPVLGGGDVDPRGHRGCPLRGVRRHGRLVGGGGEDGGGARFSAPRACCSGRRRASRRRRGGINPWTLLPHFQRFWLRGMDGGAVRVLRLGPKDARIDVVECPLFKSKYFREACCGLTRVSLCRKLRVPQVLRARPTVPGTRTFPSWLFAPSGCDLAGLVRTLLGARTEAPPCATRSCSPPSRSSSPSRTARSRSCGGSTASIPDGGSDASGSSGGSSSGSTGSSGSSSGSGSSGGTGSSGSSSGSSSGGSSSGGSSSGSFRRGAPSTIAPATPSAAPRRHRGTALSSPIPR